ncbi:MULTISPECIES: carbohydrate ABC transporter permease [unclassified Microcella]|uniref:carbohydrate ABC transporter permease n=1 Tax=unclassified Microcella TaxID=2630066 RepID=UPI0006F7A07D|nr:MULTISPECIES: carbohydrate ABC transporter permease [unclassified Microcella]KQV26445.1 sugar ABC transporter permease [Yonghaparkia sp. Root332]KRF32772.1 sugar ABC transporter permease [Yonghaparkia sp. Soil809]
MTAAVARAPRPVSVASPRRSVSRGLSTAALVLVTAAFLLPLAWLLLAAFDARATYETRLPQELSLDNFAAVLTPQTTFVPLGNSLLLSTATAAITVLVALLAAYPLSRYRSRFHRGVMYGVLFGTCLPITAIMVPVYSLFVVLDLLDSMPGTILFLVASSLPMAVFMTKSFMDAVPVTLEEAAWIDGASAMRALRMIVVPLMRPGIAVVFVFVFLQAWGNFFVPFVLLYSPSKQPAATSIYTFFGQFGSIAYGQLAAFSLLYSLPVVILYILASRLIGGSFALAGSVKG